MKVHKTILSLLLVLVVISAISLTSIKTVSAEKALTVTVSTDKPVYTREQSLAVTATFYVTSGGKPIPGADVRFMIIHDGKPGMTYNAWATDSEGKSIEHWGGSAGFDPGNYRIEATASKQGYTEAKGKGNFEVSKRTSPGVDEEKTEEKKVSLTLEHYDPFEYFKPGMGHKIEPAGDLVAMLKDEDGKGIPHERVVFYAIKEENPRQKEPGKNLRGVLKPAPMLAFEAPIYDILNIDRYTYLDVYYTDDKGEANVNYILQNLIDPKEFSKTLLQQSYMHGEDGKIGGTIKAVVLERKGDEWKIKYEASIPIEFKGIAQIVKISGEGRSLEFKEAYTKEYPDSPTWGQGRVRVKRILTFPNFDYKPVEEGFLLMPGDIIDMDGNTKIEIVWINGNRATVVVPDKIQLEDTEYRPPHARMVLLPTAYESGFYYPLEGIIADLFGFGTGKGTDCLIQSIPVAGGALKFGVDVYKSITKELDWSKQAISTKVRIRSTVRIDATGDNVKVYNIEGSPDIKTVKGEEVTLADKEMVTISENGSLSKVQSFDPEKVLNEFFDTIPSTTDVTGLTFESRSKPSGSSVQIPLTLNGIEEKIGNMDMTLSYDPSILEATEVIKGGLTENSLFDSNIMDGTIKISLADNEGFSGDGSIAYIKFDVIGVEGSSSPLQITEMIANKADDYKELDIQTNDGEFRVISIEEGMGDGDGDGEYTALDALYALQMAVEKIPQDPVMDINEDGSVTSLDARGILKNAVGE